MSIPAHNTFHNGHVNHFFTANFRLVLGTIDEKLAASRKALLIALFLCSLMTHEMTVNKRNEKWAKDLRN